VIAVLLLLLLLLLLLPFFRSTTWPLPPALLDED
jgi:hypothetical protein